MPAHRTIEISVLIKLNNLYFSYINDMYGTRRIVSRISDSKQITRGVPMERQRLSDDSLGRGLYKTKFIETSIKEPHSGASADRYCLTIRTPDSR